MEPVSLQTMRSLCHWVLTPTYPLLTYLPTCHVPRFQFTGETPVQGVPPKGSEEDPEYDRNSAILQLYAGRYAGGSQAVALKGDTA